MLRRLLRSLGSVGALWTLVVLSSPVRLHACPEGHLVPASASAGHSGHGAHAAHAGTGAHDGSVVDPSGDHSAVPSAGDCDCIDCCCATESTTVAVGSLVAVDTFAWPRAIVADPTETSAPASAVPHRLPFANGPPGLIG